MTDAPRAAALDLFGPTALAELMGAFAAALAAADAPLAARWRAYMGGEALAGPDTSALLLAVAPHVESFVADLFGVRAEVAALGRQLVADEPLVAFRRHYLGKRLRGRQLAAVAAATEADLKAFARLADHLGAGAAGAEGAAAERRLAQVGLHLLGLAKTVSARPAPPEATLAAAADDLAALARRAAGDAPQAPPKGPEAARAQAEALLGLIDRVAARQLAAAEGAVALWSPEARDPAGQGQVPTVRPDPRLPERRAAAGAHRRRDGFALTDPRMPRRAVHGHADYCLKCHPRGRDSCRTGLRRSDGAIVHNALGRALTGCPLEERISEAHVLRQAGHVVAALAVICIDNPMCAGTGHRICNDCMQSCIFQRQEPVDVPQVETGILTEVLGLPFGLEIYLLLGRWNPLNRRRPTPRAYRGRDVLVVGLGPAGYTLAHHLLNEGFGVVAVDALKLEPLPAHLLGEAGRPPPLVRDWSAMCTSLADRPPLGFGGVAEYGITVRWDKNFLRALYLALARRPEMRMFGGVRLGSTLTLEEAWGAGFDHVALAAGAGRPNLVPMPNALLRGMRAASDFLMALQLGGAGQPGALANLQCELPAVVVGGGLTAVDAATEIAAFYPLQCERLAAMVDALGETRALADLDGEQRGIAARLLGHGREVQAARRAGALDPGALVRAWGGVTVVYRRALEASPAYRANPEEVRAALAEGITFAECLTPTGARADAFGHVDGLEVRRADGEHHVLPARAVLIATGVRPNTIYEREHPGTFAMEGAFFRAHRAHVDEGGALSLTPAPQRAAADAFFTSAQPGGRRAVTFFGDNHPAYAGSVVGAMASAKRGHRAIVELLPARADAQPADFHRLADRVAADWRARVLRVTRLSTTTVEVVVHAPAQARRFRPGQFFRLQNFAATAPQLEGRPLLLESLALTGAEVDAQAGWLSMVALECGVSTRLLSYLTPGEEVVLMGPTGAPTEVVGGERVVLCGGGLGNAVLMSVGRAMRQAGCHVTLFAAYRRAHDIFKQASMEAAGDVVVWCTEAGPAPPGRPQDRTHSGRVTEALAAHADLLRGCQRFLTIGSDRMMAAVAAARRGPLAAHLPPDHVALASINSPMQCMMKELCAQCLQRQVDPATGEERFVFSCFNQDQPQDHVDWQHLRQRLGQNALSEHVTGRWLAGGGGGGGGGAGPHAPRRAPALTRPTSPRGPTLP